MAADREGGRERVVHAGGDAQAVTRVDEIRDDERAFVATEGWQRHVAGDGLGVVDADAGDEIAFAQAARQSPQGLAQQRVAALVAEHGVQRAETVEVHEQEREARRRRVPGGGDQPLDVRAQGEQARQPGQGVGAVAFLHVGEGAGQAHRVSGRVTVGHAFGDHPAERPGLRPQPVFTAEGRCGAAQVPVERVHHRRDVVGVHAAQPRVQRLDGVVPGVAEQGVPRRRVGDPVGGDGPLPGRRRGRVRNPGWERRAGHGEARQVVHDGPPACQRW